MAIVLGGTISLAYQKQNFHCLTNLDWTEILNLFLSQQSVMTAQGGSGGGGVRPSTAVSASTRPEA